VERRPHGIPLMTDHLHLLLLDDYSAASIHYSFYEILRDLKFGDLILKAGTKSYEFLSEIWRLTCLSTSQSQSNMNDENLPSIPTA
jgi:hypothetical protein